MVLSEMQLQQMTHLARLTIDESSIEATKQQLNHILDFFVQLDQMDTEQVAPMSHSGDITLTLRADRAEDIDQRSAFQAFAPAVEKHLYLVPKVID